MTDVIDGLDVRFSVMDADMRPGGVVHAGAAKFGQAEKKRGRLFSTLSKLRCFRSEITMNKLVAHSRFTG